jgi:hypothetical protein
MMLNSVTQIPLDRRNNGQSKWLNNREILIGVFWANSRFNQSEIWNGSKYKMSQCALLHSEFDVLDYFGKICKSETTIMNFVEESVKTVDNLKDKYFEMRKRILDPLLAFTCDYPKEILHYNEWKKLKEELAVCEQQLQARAILKKNDKDGAEAQSYDTEKRKRDTIFLRVEDLQTKFNRDSHQDIESRKHILSKNWIYLYINQDCVTILRRKERLSRFYIGQAISWSERLFFGIVSTKN